MTIADQTSFEDHFPVTVMVSHHTGLESINQDIFGVIRRLRDQNIDNRNENEALSGTITTYGGYQTSKKLMFLNLQEAAVQTLREQVIMPGIKRYLAEVYKEHAAKIGTRVVSWANILREGDWQAPHMHPTAGNLISGVYYVNVPEKPVPQGCIEFLNPHPAAHYHNISLTRRLHPKTGDLMLFPPYHIHYVYPFSGDGERAIIAFDVLQAAHFV